MIAMSLMLNDSDVIFAEIGVSRMPLEHRTGPPRLPFAEAAVRATRWLSTRTGVYGLQDIFDKL
jgi:hypothetical protein